MSRGGRRAATAALLVIAVALFGEGAWIYLKAELAQRLLHRAWTRTLAGGTRVKPWPWADTWPVARMRLPENGADFIVLAGTTGRTLAFGPGHWSGTALPGEPGHCVLSGHRDTQFAPLARLVRGDRVLLETPTGHRHVYRVEELRMLDRGNRGRAYGRLERRIDAVTRYVLPLRGDRLGRSAALRRNGAGGDGG